MAQLPPIKRGDTFAPLLTYTDAQGYPIDLTEVEITSQVRDLSGGLVANLTVTKLDQSAYPGKYTLTAETASWPAQRQLQFDIRYVRSGAITHTESALLRIDYPVTVPT